MSNATQLLAALRARGIADEDLYAAAHEGAHGLDVEAESWRSEDIDARLMRLSAAQRMHAEARAHGAARIVCAAVGVTPQDVSGVATLVWFGTRNQCGVKWTAEQLERAILAAERAPAAKALAARLLAMGSEVPA